MSDDSFDSDSYDELSAGDFLYQADQELFLVVMDERENSYLFAAHGWRSIDKNRVEEYTNNENGQLYTEDVVEEIIDEDASESVRQSYEQLTELFEMYEDMDVPEFGPQEDFAMDDTE